MPSSPCIFTKCPSCPSCIPRGMGAHSLTLRESLSLPGRKSSSRAAPSAPETGEAEPHRTGWLEVLRHPFQARWPWESSCHSLNSVSLPVSGDIPPTSLWGQCLAWALEQNRHPVTGKVAGFQNSWAEDRAISCPLPYVSQGCCTDIQDLIQG